MSLNFNLSQPSKASFKQDSTALEILNNYSKLNSIQIRKKNTTEKLLNPLSLSSDPATLVYDIRADIIIGTPTPYQPCEPSKPYQEITESNLKSYLQAKLFTPSPAFEPEYSLTVPEDGVTLRFDSKFESGNLEKAIKISDTEYSLIISCDVNTQGQNHWYYFSVKNPKKSTINFEILNMLKLDDLYKTGLKPAVFSNKYFEKTGVRWHRDCTNISYKPNKSFLPGRNFYSLSFSYDFRYPSDTVFFAYSVPYTYTELSNFLQYIKDTHHKIARVNTICKTIAGNSCELLTITEDINSYPLFEEEFHKWGVSSSGRQMLKNKQKRQKLDQKSREKHCEKAGIVLTARVHAGETVSSFMMKGAIEFLLGESREARVLRKKFVFKIVPMLNPDGVRYGNYRCSLIGVDLNRRWDKPSRVLHPTIFYAKKMIEVFSEDHRVLMICDMHGHSKKRNVFMYGCAVKTMDCLEIRKNLMAKTVPVFLDQLNRFFCFKDCHFRLEKSKMSTERIVIYKDLGIAHSYTIEASFFGPLNKKVQSTDYHMNESDLESIGKDLCRTCMIFTSQSIYLAKIRQTNNFLRNIMFKKKNIKRETEKEKETEKETETGTGTETNKNILSPENTEKEEALQEPEIESNTDPLKLEDEKIWDGIEIAEYSESDDEGSGGSDSCPSEKIDFSPIQDRKLKKGKFKKFEKNVSEVSELGPNQDNLNFKDKDEPGKTIEKGLVDEELKENHLEKNYSFKPKLRAVFSKKVQSKEQLSSVPPNLRSQNTIFNYPLISNAIINSEPSARIDTESSFPHIKDKSFKITTENPYLNNSHLKMGISEFIRNDIRRKIRLSSQANLGENCKASTSFINVGSPKYYSFEKKSVRKIVNQLSYSKNVLPEFNQSYRRGYIAKNLADTALFRIEKIVSKFSSDR